MRGNRSAGVPVALVAPVALAGLSGLLGRALADARRLRLAGGPVDRRLPRLSGLVRLTTRLCAGPALGRRLLDRLPGLGRGLVVTVGVDGRRGTRGVGSGGLQR